MSVNPSSLSMDNSPSPAPESPDSGPSRKRARTSSTTADDRKEARAHRNRIAAQNSRDRRKAQFSYLERRVSELEEENRQLRAGLVVPASRPEQTKAEEERERAKERENEELRERIKTLEKGWDAVMKALAAQGLSTGTAPPAAPQPPTEPSPTTPEPPTKQQPTESPAPTFPALEPTMTFPISPAPSHNSLDFDLDLSSSSSFMSSPVITPKTEHDLDSTRHLARVASIVGGTSPSPMALQRVVSTSVSNSTVSPALTTAAPPVKKARSTTQPWRTCSARSSPPRAWPRRVFLLTFRVAPHQKLPPRMRRRHLPSSRK
ncbi:hypothetical protein DFH06DRAFT_423591 [Mycena polygramma]|nr:hypothetical protein DFH06DRAFT_423591 [Mycena polygramma]